MTDPTRFKRAALIVADLDRAFALYRDALGFTLHSVKNSPGDSYSYEIFGIPAGSTLRMAALNGAADQERTLALLEVTPAIPRPTTPFSATVTWVADMEETLKALKKVPGLTLFPERPLHTHDGKIGREIGGVDADGHAIVVYHV